MSAQRTPGPWVVDSHAFGIWAPNAKIGGDTKIFDIRGWGYLTGQGHGALALSCEEAKAIQMANGCLAAAAPEMLATLTLVRAWLKDELVWNVVIKLPNETFGECIEAAIAKATGET